MIVSLLAYKVALSPNAVRSLIRSLVDVACNDAKDSTDLRSFRMSFMALVNLVQVLLEYLLHGCYLWCNIAF